MTAGKATFSHTRVSDLSKVGPHHLHLQCDTPPPPPPPQLIARKARLRRLHALPNTLHNSNQKDVHNSNQKASGKMEQLASKRASGSAAQDTACQSVLTRTQDFWRWSHGSK